MLPEPAADSSRNALLASWRYAVKRFRVIALENEHEPHGPDVTLSLEDHLDLLKDWLGGAAIPAAADSEMLEVVFQRAELA